MSRVRPHTSLLLSISLFTGLSWLAPAMAMGTATRVITIPALLVGSDHDRPVGALQYIVIQIDHDPARTGPVVLFRETRIGSAVDTEWKAGVRTAVDAAAAALGVDARAWRVTVMNRSPVAFTQGSSASAAVAVGLMAAWKQESLREEMVLTGLITPTGTIAEVADLASKLEGAAHNGKTVLLVPRGQARTKDWDLFQLGLEQRVLVLEVGTLREAYEYMTGKRPAN